MLIDQNIRSLQRKPQTGAKQNIEPQQHEQEYARYLISRQKEVNILAYNDIQPKKV